MSTLKRGHYLVVTAAVVALLVIGCAAGATFHRSKSRSFLSEIIIPLHGRVYIDNPTDEALSVFINGRRRSALPSRDIAVFDLRPGVHTFALHNDQGIVDQVEGRVRMHKEHAFAPAGSSGFYLLSQKYTADSRIIWGVGQMIHAMDGTQWLTSPERKIDAGLFQELPAFINMPSGKQVAYEVKLFKALAGTPDAREAALVIGANRQAYSFDDKLKAVDVFAQVQLAPEYADVLFACMEREPILAERCAAALQPYVTGADLPRIKRMLKRRFKKEQRFDHGFTGAVRLWAPLVAPQEVLDLYREVSDTRKPAVLESVFTGPAELRRVFVEYLMQQPVSEQNTGWILRMAGDGALLSDMAFIKTMDEFLAALPAESGKHRKTWDLIMLQNVPPDAGPEVFARIAGLCKREDYEMRGAVSALIDSGHVDVLVQNFSALSQIAKNMVFERLQALDNMPVSAQVPLAEACLASAEDRQRLFNTLTPHGRYLGDKEELSLLLMRIIDNETDAGCQREMGKKFAGTLWRDEWQNQPAPLTLMGRMLIYGDVVSAQRALGNLFNQPEKRAGVWALLKKICPEIRDPAARLDLIWRAERQQFDDFPDFLGVCLADADAEVRQTAFDKLAGRLRYESNGSLSLDEENRRWLELLQASARNEPDRETRMKMDARIKTK